MNVLEEDILQERYELAYGRIKELAEELSLVENEYLSEKMTDFFAAAACYLVGLLGEGMAAKEDCKNTYLNPEYAVAECGAEHGKILSWLYYELHSLEPFLEAGCKQEIVIRLELFLEIFASYAYEWSENREKPEFESIRRIMYWFAFDYADVAAEQYVEELFDRENCEGGIYTNSISILYDFLPGRTKGQESMSSYAAKHRADIGLILDRGYVSRRLEAFKTVLERKVQDKTIALGQWEAFGEDLDGLSREQKILWKEYCLQIKKYVAQLA